jgi:hypothetical protein
VWNSGEPPGCFATPFRHQQTELLQQGRLDGS